MPFDILRAREEVYKSAARKFGTNVNQNNLLKIFEYFVHEINRVWFDNILEELITGCSLRSRLPGIARCISDAKTYIRFEVNPNQILQGIREQRFHGHLRASTPLQRVQLVVEHEITHAIVYSLERNEVLEKFPNGVPKSKQKYINDKYRGHGKLFKCIQWEFFRNRGIGGTGFDVSRMISPEKVEKGMKVMVQADKNKRVPAEVLKVNENTVNVRLLDNTFRTGKVEIYNLQPYE